MWLEWLELEIVPAVDISEMHLLKTPVEDWRLIASDSSINEYGEHGIPFSSNGIEALADGMFGALFAWTHRSRIVSVVVMSLLVQDDSKREPESFAIPPAIIPSPNSCKFWTPLNRVAFKDPESQHFCPKLYAELRLCF